MKENIRQLLTLQEQDLGLDRLRADLATIPGTIASLKKQITEAAAFLEDAKKDIIRLQLQKKEKEVDLESKETAIRKHAAELNAVKTNEAYRALLGEMDKAKAEKSLIEDDVLQFMEQIDQANRQWKEREKQARVEEAEWIRQVGEWEAKQASLIQQITAKQAERDQLSAGLTKTLYERYERIRKGKGGASVVPLKNEQCSGCHMRVSQNLINEVRRGQSLIFCESCSRIVYLETVPAS